MLSLLLCAVSTAHAALLGSPPTARYTPDLDVYPQNFAIAQDARGVVYVGNTNGVMEFDGERWSLVPLDNHDIVRSLAIDAAGRVYVGGYNAMGYLERDANGEDHYVDLTPRFAALVQGREFADIWDVLVAPEGVYFRAVRDVYAWNPADGAVRAWHHEGRFGAIVRDGDLTLLQFRGEGLKRRDGEGWTLLPGTSTLTDPVHALVPLHDGGFLALSTGGPWRRVTRDAVAALAMPASVPPASNLSAGIALKDGSLALAAQDGMLYIVDARRTTERHFQLDPGYLSGVCEAFDGGFLVAANQAAYHVNWPTPWSVLGSEHGMVGSPERIAHWNGEDFLLSSAGVTRLHAEAGGTPRFEALPGWSEHIAYDLYGLEARRALLATSHKLMMIEDGRAREVSGELIYPRAFFPSRLRPGRIYLGTEMGLRSIDLDGERLTLSPAHEDDPALRVASLVERSADELWFGTERHGVWRVRLDAAGAIREQTRFGPEQGLASGSVPDVQVLERGGQLLASTSAGLFRWDGERFVADDVDGLAALRNKDEDLRLAVAPDGDEWAYGLNRLLHRPRNGTWREEPVRALRRGAYGAHDFGPDGRALFVTTQSLLLYDPSQAPVPAAAPRVLLRAVTQLRADGTRLPLPLAPSSPLELPQGDYGLQFQFALPDLALERGRRYQGRLVGYESTFSDWSSVRGYVYSRLSPGSYALEVRARDSAGAVTQTAPYRFVVLAPWYARWWAQLALAACGAALIGAATQAAIRRRTRRLDADKLRLEAVVAVRTQELALANQRLLTMASVDGLTGIANRRGLDDYLAAVWAQAGERGRSVAALLIDVDHFKRYNDSCGHLAGDQLLKDIVAQLGRCLRRAEDLLARYGGEEFLAVLPGADTAAAAAVAEAMRGDVEAANLGATVSIGVASLRPGDGVDVSALIGAADAALYRAKAAGRNRVDVASDEA